MTAIVGLEHGGRVTLGGDSAVSSDSGDIWISRDPKVFRLGEYLIGLAGATRPFDVVRYMDPPHPGNGNPDKTMRTEFVPALKKALDEAGAEFDDSEALVALRGRLYVVHADLGVDRPSAHFHAVGCGGPPALAAMHLTDSGLTAEQRITEALKIAAASNWSVRGPWKFVTG